MKFLYKQDTFFNKSYTKKQLSESIDSFKEYHDAKKQKLAMVLFDTSEICSTLNFKLHMLVAFFGANFSFEFQNSTSCFFKRFLKS